MTKLKAHLIDLIKAQGPLAVDQFMSEALSHPQYGYYTTRDPFGRQGDFITAPEISQTFGEMIGLWFGHMWLEMGSPSKFYLAEAGPGRGTLMQDMLRVLKTVPGFLDACNLHLVEISPTLRDIQKEKLAGYTLPTWHDQLNKMLEQMTDAPFFMVGNEFLDALPIKQFEKTNTGWHERLVGLTDNAENLTFSTSFSVTQTPIPDMLDDAEDGAIFESCPAAENITADLSQHLRKFGGIALFIDYGYDRYGTGDTLQALENHQYADVFENPGQADLTAHVNFKKLSDITTNHKAASTAIVTQGAFLKELGIEHRAQQLIQNATEDQKNDIMTAVERLISPDQMGELFKVMAIHDPDLPQPIAGFKP